VVLRVLTSVVAFYSTSLLQSHCASGPDMWPQGSCTLYRRGTLARNSQLWCWWLDKCHVTSPRNITPMRDIVWVDGSPSIVAALLCCGIRSPHIVAYPLRMSGRSASYYHHHVASMSYTHLMTVIHYVWPVTYAFNALPAPRTWRDHDGSDVRCLRNARTRPGAESNWARGGSEALPHQEVGLEP
jgi:hypothetical protein